jgi:hypothetical protein
VHGYRPSSFLQHLTTLNLSYFKIANKKIIGTLVCTL